MSPALSAYLSVGLFLVGCAGDAPPRVERSSPPGAGGAASTEAQLEAECADLACTDQQFCIKTQGAVCGPLPPEGEACPEGCTLTEHCCNCPAFSCLNAPEDECPAGPNCECLKGGFLLGCEDDRRECFESIGKTNVLCIQVAFDEDPFATGGGGAR